MIDFKKLVVVKTLTLEQGDVHFLDLSAAKIKSLTAPELKKKKPDVEKMLLAFLDSMLCDEKGALCNLSKEDYENMPRSVFQELALFAQSLAMGEKKS
jgi:hypothetical protein